MKLKEFLKRFEGLDPELDLYRRFSRNLHSDTVVRLEEVEEFPYISYVEQKNMVASADKDNSNGQPILVIFI